MGRRSYKKVTVNGEVTLHQRYIYRGYLQIGNLEKLAKRQFVGMASRRRAESSSPAHRRGARPLAQGKPRSGAALG